MTISIITMDNVGNTEEKIFADFKCEAFTMGLARIKKQVAEKEMNAFSVYLNHGGSRIKLDMFNIHTTIEIFDYLFG